MAWWPQWRAWRAEQWVDDRKRAERWQRRNRRFGRLVAFSGLLLLGGPAAFIGVVCSGSGSQPPRELIAPVPMPARDESLTFLGVPERVVIQQTDEYASHLAKARPSTFPYLEAAQDYWGSWNTACGVTTQEYAFNNGQQMSLGLLGAGYTADLVLKGAYENTLGRLVEWLATNDTPEDRFAAETARELARFEHTAPWQQFPFGARLKQLWGSTPAWGAHVVRKWERRMVLTVEYSAKAVVASAARLVSSGPPERDVTRLQAWIGGTTAPVLQANGAELISTVGPGSFIVTLPRGDAFTRSVVGLVGTGARVLDVAGNDEIALTAVIRQAAPAGGDQPPAGRVLSSDPLLTEPSARRITMRTPLGHLGDTIGWLREHGAVVEHLFDY
jgi:hypothetical protein